ncbi:MAG: ParB N-terminal domain-containing protein [Proteobacteria bacterium]|nr:ParB N-terminal domain-containing protein [Pseudomonadota bacterium]
MATRNEDVTGQVSPSVHLVEIGAPDESGSVWVPLNLLKKSANNVRTVPHTSEHITELAAMIDADGQLYPLILEREAAETGEYLVTAGEGRRLAQLERVRQGKIASDEPIWCKLGTPNRAVELSLSDNKQQPMHPADEFVAFRKLVEQGRSIEYIAAYRGIKPVEVKKRLKLANVAPEFLDMYRNGTLEIDHMMAFALTDDHEQQRVAWSSMPNNDSAPPAEWLRRALIADELPLTAALARFVGAAAYEKAGGAIRPDLFRDDAHGYIMDVRLLTKLATEKLEKAAVKLKKEGCTWTESRLQLDFSELQTFGRVETVQRDYTPEEAARLEAIAQERQKLESECTSLEKGDERLTELRELDLTLQAETQTIIAACEQPHPEQQRIAGAIVTIDPNSGKLRIERGLLRPADKKRIQKEKKVIESNTDGKSASAKRTHSAALLLELTAHRTMALQAVLADRPDVALLALTHRMIIKTFSMYSRADSAVQIAPQQSELDRFAKDIKQAKAYKILAERRAALKAQLPRKADALFAWLMKQPQSEVLALLAFCVALTLNDVRNDEDSGASGALVKAAGLDMREWWTATAANYFGRIPKERVINIVSKAVSPEAAGALRLLKKDNAAQLAEERMASIGWLPDVLRTPEG